MCLIYCPWNLCQLIITSISAVALRNWMMTISNWRNFFMNDNDNRLVGKVRFYTNIVNNNFINFKKYLRSKLFNLTLTRIIKWFMSYWPNIVGYLLILNNFVEKRTIGKLDVQYLSVKMNIKNKIRNRLTVLGKIYSG